MSDAKWVRIELLLPSSDGCPGRPFRDHRQVVEGIVYRYRTSLAWRDLPEQFGLWQTGWKRHRRFSLDGTWDRLHAAADATGQLDWQVRGLHGGAGASARGHHLEVPRGAPSHTGGAAE